MPSLSKREKILLAILGIIVFGYVYYNFVITPQLDTLKVSTENLVSNMAVLDGLKDSEKKIDSVKKEVEDLNKKMQESVKSIPDASRVPEIIVNIKDMVQSSGCTGGKLTFGIPDSSSQTQNAQNGDAKNVNAGIHIIPITYQVNGSYENILSFLKQIESSDRKMTIDKINISKDPEKGNLSATINVNCFYMGKDGQKIDYPFVNTTPGKQDIFN